MAKSKKTQPRKKKAPQGMTTVQQDAVQDMKDKKLSSVPAAMERGEIDPGADVADPQRGVLDPAAFDDFEAEYKSTGSETKRIKTVICEHLDKEYSRGGKDKWTAGFFLETDPRSQGEGRWTALTPQMIGSVWCTQFQRELGLTLYNGALCWNGRGTTERHIVCVKTIELQQRQLEAKAEAANQLISQPDPVDGKAVGTLEVAEKVKKLPVVPVRDGDTVKAQ